MAPIVTPDPRLKLLYEMAADRYLRSLPLEHFMEATPHATQRKITLESFDLIHEARPDVQCFNELLVQYPVGDPAVSDDFGQVVPDNMVVIHPHPLDVEGSFNTPLQPAGPVLVLEYVSKGSRRKDYDENMRKYEQQVRVPYYLLFYPDNEELSVFRLIDRKYTTVTPNAAGRLSIPELELEVGLLDGWVRYWFRGDLQPLPGALLRQLNAVRDQLKATQDQLHNTQDQLNAAHAAQQTAERRAAAAEAALAKLLAERARE